MNRINTIICLLILVSNVQSQDLPSLYETIKYLEDKMKEPIMKGSYYYYEGDLKDFNYVINVSEDGYISFTEHFILNDGRSMHSKYELPSDDIKVDVHSLKMSIDCIRNYGCAKHTFVSGSTENYSGYSFKYDNRASDKTRNALDHLINLAQAKASIYKDIDTDPFSKNNYSVSTGKKITVPVKKVKSGLNELEISIGEKTVKGYIDSGASHIVIPLYLLDDLVTLGYINSDRKISYASIANGDIIATYTHEAPIVIVGNSKFENITISAIDSDIDILIGQSLLGKFNNWKIDNLRSELIIER